MDIVALKQEYNGLLKRFKAGSAYLDNDSIPDLEKDDKLPAFIRILDRLNGILFCFKENGISYTDDNVLNGFTEVSV